ncbi:hypothetical protein UFOVP1247_274 [uncultured Caudovirales phage]|uniref:Uncharacterized protein n=1 Tax=uncultured Caudovirales phage TaxID=2100421 RepID=A0A6J5RA09_9CAUD|nr:hypothetical protein UFOVP970_314 [uncultured Caudovirales phage]CAB4193903.1 hypothetical protein UFOVP1247_274 [uncultured Caudovirales phage]
MEKIPTAEEFNNDIRYVTYSLDEKLITFAKLHVEACKKEIVNNVETCIGGDGSPLVSIASILNSYSLDKIK